MSIKIIKKNNKRLLEKHGTGFFGRVMCVQFGDNHIVLQHVPRKPKTMALLSHCDADIFQQANEKELLINAIQRHYLKKYKKELLCVKSFVNLHGFYE